MGSPVARLIVVWLLTALTVTAVAVTTILTRGKFFWILPIPRDRSSIYHFLRILWLEAPVSTVVVGLVLILAGVLSMIVMFGDTQFRHVRP